MATSRQVSNGSNPTSDWDQGYGFQFWLCRNGAFRGDGAFGQYCVVLPEQDTVIAITSGVKDMQAVLNVIWEKLLPAMKPQPIMPYPVGKNLTEKLANLMVRPADGSETSPLATKILGRKFVFPANEQKLETITVTPNVDGKSVAVVVQSASARSEFIAGHRDWKQGLGSFGTYTNAPAAATFAWSAEDTLIIKQCFTETPFHVTHKFRLEGDQLFYEAQRNVGFGATKQPPLVGRAE
jgi:hypothetical protein